MLTPYDTVIWVYGFMGTIMKTTVEVPDELYRRAKAEAAMRGQPLRELLEEGLRLVLDTTSKHADQGPTLFQLMEPALGIVGSGLTDLATNPAHLANFGQDAKRDR